MSTQAGLVVSYNYFLVALSIFIAILAAYAALDLSGRVTTAKGLRRLAWLSGGAIAMGSGIWAMHYVGMEAFSLSVPVLYDWPTVLFSLICAILASGTALYIVSQPTMGLYRKIIGSVVMGLGIAAMHYTGMAAMRLPAMCVYSPGLVILSDTLAIAISYLALRLTFALRGDLSSWNLRKAIGTLVLGLAIPVTHYVGMAAVTFIPTATVEGSLRHAVNVSDISLFCIVLITLVLLAIVFISAWMHRHIVAQSKQFEDNFLQLQAVFDCMTDAIVVADFEAKTLLHNKAALSLMGLDKKLVAMEEVRDRFEVFLPSGEPISFEQSPMMRAARGEYCSNTELVFRNKDTGTTATTELTTVPLLDSFGKRSRVIMSVRDVGKQRLEEELIRNQKTQLQNVFDNLNEGILLMDMDRNIVQINRTAIKLLGLPITTVSRENIKNAFEVLSPNGDLIPHDKWPSSLAFTGEFVQNREFRIRRTATGDTIVAQISTAPVIDNSGKTIQIIFSYHDITETKEADEERKRLAAIVESSEDAIIGKNYDGVVTSWNRGAVKTFGYTAAEMIGQPIVRLFPPERVDEESMILNRIHKAEVIEHFETVRMRKDGKHIHVWLTISPLRDVDGKVIGASEITRDITERMKLESQLQLSQKMDAIGQLTGGIAHDFNNLLGIVIGNLDLIERRVGSDGGTIKRVHTAQKAALRGADLTRRLLAFSSNETLSPAPTNLHGLIHNMIEMTSRVIGPEIKISEHFDEAISDIVVDAAGFESALVNLVVNARDAMPKGGEITISTKFCDLEDTYPPVQVGELNPGRYACVSVSDNGEGMSRQTLEHVFEPFFTTKPRGKGTGLGLAMVYGFVKQSHGTVRIYSERNYGTTVTLYLPADEDPSVSMAAAVEPAITFTGKATVLVVDDELDLLDVSLDYLAGMGWKAYTAVDGNAALQIIEQEKGIDLMITDIVMPGGMDGVDLAHKVRLLNPKIKIVYCSGFPSDALAEHGMPLVDAPLLHKPYQRNEFTAMLRRVMGTEKVIQN